MRVADKLAVGYAYGTSLLVVTWWTDSRVRSRRRSRSPIAAISAARTATAPYIDPTNLDLAKIEILFRRLRAMGIRRLGLAGGEPMVRQDLGEIIDLAKRERFFVSVNSNLTLFDRHPERLARADLVYTSLDGDAAAHNAARGERAYEGVVDGITRLVGGGKPVIAICVVTEHSIGQADFLLRQAETIGFRMHFQPQCVDTEIVRGTVSPALERASARLLARTSRRETQRPSDRQLDALSRVLSRMAGLLDLRVPRSDANVVRRPGYLYVDPLGKAYACAYTKGKTQPVDLLANDWRTGVEPRDAVHHAARSDRCSSSTCSSRGRSPPRSRAFARTAERAGGFPTSSTKLPFPGWRWASRRRASIAAGSAPSAVSVPLRSARAWRSRAIRDASGCGSPPGRRAARSAREACRGGSPVAIGVDQGVPRERIARPRDVAGRLERERVRFVAKVVEHERPSRAALRVGDARGGHVSPTGAVSDDGNTSADSAERATAARATQGTEAGDVPASDGARRRRPNDSTAPDQPSR